MSAAVFVALALIFLTTGYFLGFHVRDSIEKEVQTALPAQLSSREQKAYLKKAEQYFSPHRSTTRATRPPNSAVAPIKKG